MSSLPPQASERRPREEEEDPTGTFDTAAPVPPVVPALGDRAAHGVVYTLAQVGSIKFLNLLAQFILSWLLVGTDFGYIGLAYSIAGFAGLISQGGVREVLIRRGREFDRWASAAFWLALTLGACGTITMMAAAPLAARFFQDPALIGPILVLAIQNLVMGLNGVMEARLAVDLRFKALSIVSFIHAGTLTLLMVFFAALGFGPYSYILPWPLASTLRLAISWWLARPRLTWHPQVHLWKHMAADNLLLMGATFFWMITAQCDYMILGRMYPDRKEVVGHYFWAFNLSTQALQLLSLNVAAVLLPSLAKIQEEPARQTRAFLRAAKLLSLLAVPGCLLQAVLADPLVRLAFKPEWYPAIPIVAVLSAGWILFVGIHSAMSMLKAQGRFAAILWFMVFEAALFLILVPIGAALGEGTGAAVAVAIHSSIFGPASVYLAIRPGGGTWRDTLDVFASPLLAGIIAFAIAALVGYSIPMSPGRWRDVVRIVTITALAGGIYLPLIYLLARPATIELRDRLRGLLRRKGPVANAATVA